MKSITPTQTELEATNETAIGLLRLAFEHVPIHAPGWAQISEFLEKNGNDLKRKDDALSKMASALRVAQCKLDYLHTHYSGDEAADIHAVKETVKVALAAAGVQS